MTEDYARMLVRGYTAGLTPEQVEQVVTRMVAKNECTWHAVSRVCHCRCHCTPCSQRRELALAYEVSEHRAMRERPSLRQARRLALVRWVLGIPRGSWLRPWLVTDAGGGLYY